METDMEMGEDLSTDVWSSEVDISQLCRVCANTNEYLIPIFSGEGLEHDLEGKIVKHLPIKVSEEDKLPTQLCYQCASTLIAWHDLVVTCVEAEDKFKGFDKETTDVQASTESCNSENNVGVQSMAAQQLETGISIEEQQTVDQIEPVLDNTADEPENIIIEGVASVESQPFEGVPSDLREVIYIKNEVEVPEMITEPEEEDNVVEAVEMYEDVETSVVVHNFVEGLEDGEYIAYITDDFVENSVEIMNQEMEEVGEMDEENKPYICEACNRIFNDLTTFKTHLVKHKIKGHFCNFCDVYYKRIDHLEKHIEIMHPTFSKTMVPREKKVNPYAKTFLCNTCGKILKSSLAYENHTLKHQSKCPFPCDLCSETFPNRGARRRHEVKVHNLLTKENGNPDGYHICEVCGLEMFSDGAYYHHKDKHGDPYPCGFCGKLYGSRSLMQVHARRHTTERPFVCTICNRNFKVKQELNAHMNIHKDLRPYQCPHCPKMCRKSSDLTHHIRTHTGEKPFICDKCGRGFAQAGDMRKHRQLHFRPSKINKVQT